MKRGTRTHCGIAGALRVPRQHGGEAAPWMEMLGRTNGMVEATWAPALSKICAKFPTLVTEPVDWVDHFFGDTGNSKPGSTPIVNRY